MRRASSEATNAEPPLTRNEIVLVDVGPASQSSQEAEGAEFLSPQQVPEPEKLEILETLLHSPYGSKDPYQFYHVLRNDKNINVNPGSPLRMTSVRVDVPQRLHRMGSGNT